MTVAPSIDSYRGPVPADTIGTTLIHEHIFVRNPELELSHIAPEWDASEAVENAVASLTELGGLGVDTVVDLTVPGLGRDPELISEVATRVPVNLIAATGWYGAAVLPPYFQFRGPGRLMAGPDPLIEMFVGDIEAGIGTTGVRAAMIKLSTSDELITPDEARVMTAAAIAAQHTGVPITTHSNPRTRNGLTQLRTLCELGVAPERVIIGHSGDTDDVDYLRELMDLGSTIGLDRFGMEHVFADEVRVSTAVALIGMGYADRIVLSHDAAIYSHVTPPTWRARHAPQWRMDGIPRRIVPMLKQAGVAQEAIDQMLVANPRRLLTRANVVQ